MTTSHHRSILKIQKPGEVGTYLLLELLIFSKYLNSTSGPSPFKEYLDLFQMSLDF